MESGVRARSVPSGDRASAFHSEKVKAEIVLSAARPSDLPHDVDSHGNPIQDGHQASKQYVLETVAPTQKGRGSPTARGAEPLRTKGKVPMDERGGPNEAAASEFEAISRGSPSQEQTGIKICEWEFRLWNRVISMVYSGRWWVCRKFWCESCAVRSP